MCGNEKHFKFTIICPETGEHFEYTIPAKKPGIGVQPEEIISVERSYLDQQICSDGPCAIEVISELPKKHYDEQVKKLKEAARHQVKPAKEKVIKRKYMPVAVLTALGHAAKEIADMIPMDYGKVRKIRSAVYRHLGVSNPATLREWMEKHHLL